MRNVKFKNISILFLFLVGVSGSVGALFYPKYDNYFRDMAPLPIIFSFSRNRTRVFYDTQFKVTTKNGQTIEKVFNTDLYRYLKGPHRRKIFLHSMLRWQRGIETDSFKRLLLSFCNPIYAKQVLKTEETIDTISVGWSNINKTASVQCP